MHRVLFEMTFLQHATHDCIAFGTNTLSEVSWSVGVNSGLVTSPKLFWRKQRLSLVHIEEQGRSNALLRDFTNNQNGYLRVFAAVLCQISQNCQNVHVLADFLKLAWCVAHFVGSSQNTVKAQTFWFSVSTWVWICSHHTFSVTNVEVVPLGREI